MSAKFDHASASENPACLQQIRDAVYQVLPVIYKYKPRSAQRDQYIALLRSRIDLAMAGITEGDRRVCAGMIATTINEARVRLER